jgi:hypothetical protein
MNIERKNGGYLIYSLVKGYLFQRYYIGYTRREAVSLYRNEIKGAK